ncbi:MAG: iron ABC transporter permease, partial [Dehalococcoidales bacterium]|nr:iron ABC transporter permease [Dehalococcoidales bacterium]
MKAQHTGNRSLSTDNGKAAMLRNLIPTSLKFQGILWLSLVLLVIVLAASLAIGRYSVPIGETIRILFSRILPLDVTWDGLQEAVVMTLRFPRTVAAIIIGSALSLSGA